jgi:hypothetical protein
MNKTIAAIMVVVALVSGPTATAAPDTTFGMSEGTSTLRQQDAKFGHVDVARVFTGSPKPWSQMPHRSLIVSFKIPARSVIAGEWDGVLRNWFRTAPTAYPVWWSYWHEPADNFRTTAQQRQYRRAWQHIVRIERTHAPRNLKSTFIHTLGSARVGTWGRHYPGDKWIETLGWDGKLHTYDRRYIPARKHYAAAVRISNRHDKPFGLAEWGSVVFGNNYQGRANWMRDAAHWLQNSGARFAAWWPQRMIRSGVGVQDHRLNDRPSIRAWRWVLRGRWQ